MWDHRVHYHFKVDGEQYSFTDIFRRKTLWYTVSPVNYIKYKENGKVSILYLDSNPFVNVPVFNLQHSIDRGRRNLILWLVWSGVCLVSAGLFGLWRIKFTS